MQRSWTNRYYDAIFACVERYRTMTTDPDLLAFLSEFNRDVPLVKLSRWLGYVQGVLIERGKTTVQVERDWTRPLFRPLDFGSMKPVTNESPLAIEARKLLDEWDRGELARGDFEIMMKELIASA